MAQRIFIADHLSLAQLKTCYEQAKDPVERSRYQIIYLLLQKKSINEVTEIISCSPQAIYSLVQRYNEGGAEAMQNLRRRNTGRPENALLDGKQKESLWVALQSQPLNGEQWDGVLVAQWISKEIGRPVSRQVGWRYLKKMRSQLRKPVAK